MGLVIGRDMTQTQTSTIHEGQRCAHNCGCILYCKLTTRLVSIGTPATRKKRRAKASEEQEPRSE